MDMTSLSLSEEHKRDWLSERVKTYHLLFSPLRKYLKVHTSPQWVGGTINKCNGEYHIYIESICVCVHICIHTQPQTHTTIYISTYECNQSCWSTTELLPHFLLWNHPQLFIEKDRAPCSRSCETSRAHLGWVPLHGCSQPRQGSAALSLSTEPTQSPSKRGVPGRTVFHPCFPSCIQ